MPLFPLKGVCSSSLSFDLTDDDRVSNVSFVGGCEGNLKAVGKLVEGKPATEVIDILEGITCGKKPTSCPDQLARALKITLGLQESPAGTAEKGGSLSASSLMPFNAGRSASLKPFDAGRAAGNGKRLNQAK